MLVVQGVVDELPPVKVNCMPQLETHWKRVDCPGWYQSSAKNNVTRSGYWNETRVVARYFLPIARLCAIPYHTDRVSGVPGNFLSTSFDRNLMILI